ncbi:MAG: RluA family pseudouridine synthase [Lachnospiraceae bacterium]|nr:RluA family pseudouridine synthase [Lachnospiraceae bacterium]
MFEQETALRQETGKHRRISLQADAALAGKRLDQLLSEADASLSRTAANRVIKEGGVEVNGRRVTKPSLTVAEGDVITAEVPEVVAYEAKPVEIPLDILYEDEEVLVVNKPKGMVVHPAAGHREDTLVNAVLAHCGETLSGIGGVLRPGIVHRIDKDTTGALVVCKNDRAHASLAAQLKAHSIEREYVALVHGHFRETEGSVRGAIARSKNDRKKMTVDALRGKEAVTHYTVLRYFPKDDITYLACRLETGRTHQIRVHMTHLGHPLLGDTVYAPKRKSRFKGLEGQCLHARTLGFTHPVTGERLRLEAPLPPYFVELLENLM